MIPVVYKHFTSAQGLGHASLSVISAPIFPAAASGHQYYEIAKAEVEYRPLAGMVRMGMIAFGATNDLARVVPAFPQFLYLDGNVPAQAVTKGAKRSVNRELWHPTRGSRYETTATGTVAVPPVTYAYTYGKVTDNGVELADGALLGELRVVFDVKFSVPVPPALSSAVNLTHTTNSLKTLTPRQFFSGDSGVLTSRTASQLAALGMPLGNPYWGGQPEQGLTEPPDVLALTSPCDSVFHLRFVFHRLVLNANAATPTQILENALIPHLVLSSKADASHVSFLALGPNPRVGATPGFSETGAAGTTHTLITTHATIHARARVHGLPDMLPIAAFNALKEAQALGRYSIAHPLEACLALGIGVATGGGAVGASLLISAATLEALKQGGASDSQLAALQSSISGSVHTFPLGSSPDMFSGLAGTGFQKYPYAPTMGQVADEDETRDPNIDVSYSAYTADGTPLPPPGTAPPPGPGGSGSITSVGQIRLIAELHGGATFLANSTTPVRFSLSYAQLTEAVYTATGAAATGWTLSTGSWSPGGVDNTMAFRHNTVVQPIYLDSLHLDFLAANNTSMPDASVNGSWHLTYGTYDAGGEDVWVVPEHVGTRHSFYGIYANRFPDLPSALAPGVLFEQPTLDITMARDVFLNAVATNIHAERTCGFTLIVVVYVNEPMAISHQEKTPLPFYAAVAPMRPTSPVSEPGWTKA